ncbi:hypothetical protein POTOM_041958 [Populus tomentosa]|uniref:Uncharacterized protein n=1 Tax=Populus tomentosa TaxID=118781 RepID=A0A8X8CGY3_POPTO|nr:hypothetical protein POTOM_041958 [Populus tomentosa]
MLALMGLVLLFALDCSSLRFTGSGWLAWASLLVVAGVYSNYAPLVDAIDSINLGLLEMMCRWFTTLVLLAWYDMLPEAGWNALLFEAGWSNGLLELLYSSLARFCRLWKCWIVAATLRWSCFLWCTKGLWFIAKVEASSSASGAQLGYYCSVPSTGLEGVSLLVFGSPSRFVC